MHHFCKRTLSQAKEQLRQAQLLFNRKIITCVALGIVVDLNDAIWETFF